MFRFNWDVNGLTLPSVLPAAEKACRTDSVAAITTDSGPAAASNPFLDAMLSNEAVGGGRASLGQEVGSSRSFVSPAIEWKPSPCITFNDECRRCAHYWDSPPFVPPRDRGQSESEHCLGQLQSQTRKRLSG